MRVRPDAPAAHANLGNAFGRAGLFVESIEPFRQALQLNPHDPALHFHLGVSLQQIGRYREALDAMREVARLDPDKAAAFVVAGYLCNQMGDPDQAILNCKKALERDANLADAHCNLGLVYQTLGLLDEAIDSFRRGEEIDPGAAPLRVNLLYALNFHPGPAPEEVFAEHRVWAARHADPLTPRNATFDNDRAANRRLRIGYVSAHFRGHAVNSFVEPILAAHDPASCEVYCYSNLVPARGDETTGRLRGFAHHWREIAHLNDEQASQMVRTDRIDILIDLAGHIEGNRLPMFARKPAPIQVTYVGYQNTTGMSAMDYRLTDEWSDPPGMTEAFYTEQLVRLPHAFFCYLPPEETPATTPLPALARGQVTFGSFNNFAKITPQVLETWARLLSAVPQSRLILLVPRSQSVSQRVREVFSRNGVEPGRVELVPRLPYRDYLRLIAQADIALDAFPFNGHTTTCDSLWTGVPVVMLAGNSYASRFGGSALVNLGLSDFIADSPEQYVEIATRRATNTERLAELRAELRTWMANSVLLDGPGFTRRLEATYRQMWRQWCSPSASD